MTLLTQIDNPFRSSIVNDAWQAPLADVPEIHADVFQECCRTIEQVRTDRASTSLLIHGPAGSGKTHLLGRLRSHLGMTPRQAAQYDRPVFTWIRLQTSPGMIWRYTRRRFADDLLRSVNGDASQFDMLMLNRFAGLRTADGDLELWWQWLHQEASGEFDELMERLGDACDFDRNMFTAIRHIALNRHRRDAKAWLRGDSLPESVLNRLELTQGRDDEEDQETVARDAVLALCRLAGPTVPVIFCFDQVEALQRHPQDMQGLFTFGQLASSLHDDTNNVLLISCVQSSFADLLQQKARGADYDRMVEHGAWSLSPILYEQACRLIQSRLDSNKRLRSLRQTHDEPLWPLMAADVKEFVGPVGMTPRRVIAWCAERFETLDSDANTTKQAEPVNQTAFLNQEFDLRYEECLKKNTPDQSEQILAHGLPLLITVMHRDWKLDEHPTSSDVHTVVQTPRGRVGISHCTRSNMTSLASQLRRLRDVVAESSLDQLILIRDSRSPITKTARKAREYLTDLKQRGVGVLHPTPEALAALDALRAVLSDAKSGDLSCGGRTVAPETVEEWLTEHLPSSLSELMDETEAAVTGGREGDSTTDVFERLAAVLTEHHVVPLKDAAAEIQVEPDQVEHAARRHSGQIGYLAGPPSILFQRVSAATAAESPESRS